VLIAGKHAGLCWFSGKPVKRITARKKKAIYPQITRIVFMFSASVSLLAVDPNPQLLLESA
jgi:hypothetical protein